MMENKVVLHLNLLWKWFEMIDAEIKKEEYRAQSDYWKRKFIQNPETGIIQIKIGKKLHNAEDVIVCFSNGFAKDRPQMFFNLKSVKLKEGKTEWGAIEGNVYFTLKLGTRLN